ncbi:MAG: DUF2236 domain-containing protein [Gammaproteobacteria bacterium]|nr:DUF2236 domain-containing protein [Gammaproteobacteria bacterium]
MPNAIATPPLDASGEPISAQAPATPVRTAPKRFLPWSIAGRKWLPDFIAKPFFGKPLAPSQDEWQRMELALWQGDPAMDKVVDWMFEVGPRHSKPLFDQALQRGIDSLTDPPPVLQEFFAIVDQAPPWLNRTRLEKGVNVAHLTGTVSFYVLRDMALMGGYAYFNSMNQTLAATGALSKDTALRLGETGKWLNDVTEPHGMERFGPGFITTLRVRLVHALVRRHLQNKAEWEPEKWGIPINQVDMLATYLAFGPATLMGARMFGLPIWPRQGAAVMHLWRYIGWLMGVDEQWLALNELDGLRKLFHTFMTHRLPDEKIRQLGQALRDEPLSRHLSGLEGQPRRARFRHWFLYQMHMSNSSLILGPVQRRQLGLPMTILPWYPAATAPFRFIKLFYCQVRGGKTLADYTRRSREQQTQLLVHYFGEREQDIIRPGAGHPAHTD